VADRLKSPPKTDKRLGSSKNAWCEFHQTSGHNLCNCLALGFQLDELIRSDFLKDYLQELQGALMTTTPTGDSASGCRLLSFLDAFFGYNQIKMHPRDECKTTFITKLSFYYYKVMPFGFKNAGATYQRLMDRVLASMIGQNVQAYVDDMVVNS